MRIELTTVSLQGSPASLGTCEPIVGEVRLELTYCEVQYGDLVTQVGFTDQCRYSPIVLLSGVEPESPD